MENVKNISLFKELINNKKKLAFISTGSLIIASVIVIIVWADIFLVKSNLFDGKFPVTKFGPLPYIGIVLCAVSFILSMFEKNKL